MGCDAQLAWKCLFTTTLFQRVILTDKVHVGQFEILVTNYNILVLILEQVVSGISIIILVVRH